MRINYAAKFKCRRIYCNIILFGEFTYATYLSQRGIFTKILWYGEEMVNSLDVLRLKLWLKPYIQTEIKLVKEKLGVFYFGYYSFNILYSFLYPFSLPLNNLSYRGFQPKGLVFLFLILNWSLRNIQSIRKCIFLSVILYLIFQKHFELWRIIINRV